MVDEFRVIFDIIDSSGSGELDLLGVKRACGLLGQKSTLEKRQKDAKCIFTTKVAIRKMQKQDAKKDSPTNGPAGSVSGLSFEELRKIFETLDKDGSGAIDFLEFLLLDSS